MCVCFCREDLIFLYVHFFRFGYLILFLMPYNTLVSIETETKKKRRKKLGNEKEREAINRSRKRGKERERNDRSDAQTIEERMKSIKCVCA